MSSPPAELVASLYLLLSTRCVRVSFRDWLQLYERVGVPRFAALLCCDRAEVGARLAGIRRGGSVLFTRGELSASPYSPADPVVLSIEETTKTSGGDNGDVNTSGASQA